MHCSAVNCCNLAKSNLVFVTELAIQSGHACKAASARHRAACRRYTVRRVDEL